MIEIDLATGSHQFAREGAVTTAAKRVVTFAELPAALLETEPIDSIVAIQTAAILEECDRRCSVTVLSGGGFDGVRIDSTVSGRSFLELQISDPMVSFYLDANGRPLTVTNTDLLSFREQVTAHVSQTRQAASNAILQLQNESSLPIPDRASLRSITPTWP